MICPYSESFHCQEIENVYDEEQDRTTKTVIKEIWTRSLCMEEKCAVWVEGRCKYNG